MSAFQNFPRITPFLWFDSNAEEAVDFYLTVFKNARRLDEVRKVDSGGFISFKNRAWRISKAFRGEYVALRPTDEDGVFDVHYCAHRIATLDLRPVDRDACGLVDNAETRCPQGPQALGFSGGSLGAFVGARRIGERRVRRRIGIP